MNIQILVFAYNSLAKEDIRLFIKTYNNVNLVKFGRIE